VGTRRTAPLRRLLGAVASASRRFVRFWGRHRVWAAVVLVLLALLAGATVDLLRIRSDLNDGREAISGLSIENLDKGLVPTITAAADELRHADRLAHHSPFLAVLGVVPGVRSQVTGLRDMTSVTDRLGRTGVTVAKAIDRQLEQAGGNAHKRVTLLDTVSQQLDVVQGVIAKTHVGAHGPLVLPLANARKQLVRELDKAPDRLAQARFYVDGLRRLLVGPSHYMVLAANNAEMRGGAGMPLQGGVVTIADGDINFGDFLQLAYQKFPPPPVWYPASWRSTYIRWNIGKSYPETAVSPNFAVTGPIYEQMAQAMGFGKVDGVLEVDAVALSHLLKVIGPVELEGIRYTAANVEQQVLNANYVKYDTLLERGQRADVQAALAKAIFQAFKDRDVPVVKLALAMRDAAKGRHLLAHSDDPAVQSLWASVGADGKLPEAGLMVTVQNVDANKLDWFVQPTVTMNVLPALDGSWHARLTVAVTNPVPPKGQDSPYVDGSYDGPTKGSHRPMVAVYLPGTAYNITSLDLPFSERGADPPLQMAANRFRIPLGQTTRVAFDFSMPKSSIGAIVLPSGRVRPVTYVVNGQKVTDAVPVPVLWVQTKGPDNGPGAPGVAAVLALAGALMLLVGIRARLQLATVRPMRPLPDLLQRAPSLAFVLFVAALGVLVAGVLINGPT
jgi:hypothetical protein